MVSGIGFRVSSSWVLLMGCILFGIYGTGALSYSTLTGGSPCPSVFVFRACYLVFGAYLAMAVAQFMGRNGVSRILFWGGWVVAFGFAAFGSSAEIVQGGVCPIVQPAGLVIPMCYISLALCIAIASFYLIVEKQAR